MKLFVTGASGFIGSHLMLRLSRSEHSVRCLVRNTSQISRMEGLGAVPIVGDLRDKDSLVRGMEGCDCLLNLAANISFWERDRSVYTAVNVEGTRNVMEAALETGMSKVVHVSAAAVLGKSTAHPVTENSPTQPSHSNEYIRSKYAGDLIAWDLHYAKGLPLVVLYPVGVVGPGDKVLEPYIRNLVFGRMRLSAFGDSALTFVHVRDVAEAIVRAAEKENNEGEKYVVGKHVLSMRDFNEAICEIARVSAPRIRLPDGLATAIAHLLTWVADLTKRPPMMGLSIDSVRMIRGGFVFDGSKAERELGIAYTPIKLALEEIVGSFPR